MTRQISLGDTTVIQDILARIDNLNTRLGVVERMPPRGITSVLLNSASHLIVTYTDGSIGDAGVVVGGATPTPTPAYLMDFRIPANARYLGAML